MTLLANPNGPEPVYKYVGTELVNLQLKLGKIRFLIVGTGRCGTVGMAKLLTSVGIGCGHETIFKHDGIERAIARMEGREPIDLSEISKLASVADEKVGVEWFGNRDPLIIADSSYMAAPFIDHPYLNDVSIIHVVREPMKVINSFVAGMKYFQDWCLHEEMYKEYHEFLYKYVPEIPELPDPVSRAAMYYIRWNEMIEKKAKGKRYYLHRVEHDGSKLFKFLEVKPLRDYYFNPESNHKFGLVDTYDTTNYIPNVEVRRQLIAMRGRYYATKFI